MNPRIQELAEQAGGNANVLVLIRRHTYFNIEKFAELIVLETINCAAHIEGIEAIKQHFGIDNN